MAEEAIVAADSPAPLEHKRKHEDGETEALEPSMGDSNAVEKAAVAAGDSEESEAKRPRAEEQPDELVTENGFQEQKVDEPVKEDVEPPSMDSGSKIENAQESIKEEALEMVNKEQTSNEDHQIEDIQQTIVENSELENSQQQPYPGVLQDASAQVPQQGDISSSEQKPASDTQTTSQKIEVPNNKVGVLIGKAGDTIRFLQKNSGAKIQITRDADTDPQSTTRAVELIGTPENIIKAEKLIQDVIAEADAGGSPSLVARGFSTVQAAGAAEQILIQVPNEKVGVIIGKGGETIKSLQTRSGARIQLIPQHLPEGDQSKERTVRVSGDKKQIEIAREMIKEVMTQPARQLPRSWGHNQQGVHPRGAPSHWGSRSPHPAQPTGYEYHRGPYPSQNSQYPPQGYGNYPQQQAAPRSSLVPGMGQRPQMMQGPPLQGDYYGGQGRMLDTPKSAPPSNAVPAHGPGPSPVGPPPSYGNYNYGQHGTDYGLQAPYSQVVPSQNYGHGYNEAKYENQAPSHQPHVDPQQMAYPQGATYPGYNPQDQYGKPSYAVPPHGPPSQSYVQPRAGQPADVPYQGPVSSTQPYGQTAPAQQAYPFPPSGHMQQQTYPPYASAAATEGYIQQTPVTTASGPVYPQQGGQPVAGYYGQPGGQQAPGYAQVASQPAQNSSGYGYHQGAADPAYASGPVGGYSAAAAGQAGYVQPAPPAAQPGYVQYDSTQMYGAHH